jgi:hypothetical protein
MVWAEFGVDSFFIHSMAQALNDNGRGFWLMDFTSYFGIYPFSYPSAAPFLLSAFSQVSGLDINSSIFILSTLLGVLSFFTAYMCASIFFENDYIKIMIGFFYSTTPLLIKYTSMTFPSRGLFLVMVPLILWLFLRPFKDDVLFRVKRAHNFKLLILCGIMLFTSFTIHYSAWLLLAFILVFVIIKLGLKISNGMLTSIESSFIPRIFINVLAVTFAILVMLNLIRAISNNGNVYNFLDSLFGSPGTLFIWFIIGFLFIFNYNWLVRFKNQNVAGIGSHNRFFMVLFLFLIVLIGSFIHPFSSSEYNNDMSWFDLEGLDSESADENAYDPGSAITTLVMLMLGRYGFILILALLGLISIIRFKDHSVGSWKPWFLVCSTLLALPFVSLAPYPLEIFVIIITIFSGFGMNELLKVSKKHDRIKLSQATSALIIIAVLISSSYTVSFRLNNEYGFTGDRNYIDDELMELAIYLDANSGDISFKNPDYIQTSRLSTLTGLESRYKIEHDFQYLILRDPEFNVLEVSGVDISWDSFLNFKESFYRPYAFKANFTLLPREYYVGPEHPDYWINSTEFPDMKNRFYRIYSNDRSTMWLVSENFGRAVIYK